MADDSFDAVIVGASLAGCTAAVFLGRRGAKVALVDRLRDANAYKKACTHFIQPCGTPTLERLGLTDAIEQAGGVRNSAEMFTEYGWILTTIDEYGYNIRREKLDPMLRDLAVRTKGVELRMGHSARALLRESNRVTGLVVEDAAGTKHELRAKVVIGADGRHSKIAPMAGLEAKQSPNERFLYAAYYKNLPLVTGQRSLLWFNGLDVAYCFPNEDGLTCATVMPHKDKLPAFRENLEEAFLLMYKGLPRAPNFAAAERVGDFFGMIEMPNHIRHASAPGVALVGDAAMTSDPAMGVGCGWALQTGEWLAEDLGDALVRGSQIDDALALYKTHHAARLKAHHYLINRVSLAKPLNPIEKLLFSASTKDESLARDFGRVGARLCLPTDVVGPRYLARALWAVMTKRPLPTANPSAQLEQPSP